MREALERARMEPRHLRDVVLGDSAQALDEANAAGS